MYNPIMAKRVRLDRDLYIQLRAQGRSQEDAARQASSDGDTATQSALRARGHRLDADPRIQRGILTANMSGRRVARQGWKQAVKRLSRMIDDPNSTNMDIIGASRILGTATGELRERTDVTVEHRVVFKALIEPAAPEVIEARAVAGRDALEASVLARSLPGGTQDTLGATCTTPPVGETLGEVQPVLGADPPSFSLAEAAPPPTPVEAVSPVAEYAPGVPARDLGYGDAREAFERECQECWEKWSRDGDVLALKRLRWMEQGMGYKFIPRNDYRP